MADFTFVFSLIFLRHTLVAGESCKTHLSEYGFALVHHAYKSFTADHLATCYIACIIQPACQSLNYNLADKTCDLNNDTKYYRANYFVEKANSVYADNPESEFYTEDPWRKLNTVPVCFGARNDKFGKLVVEVGGSVKSVKLVHVSGVFKCKNEATPTNWGCFDDIGTVLTQSDDAILLPESKKKWYKLPGYTPTSEEIVFTDLKNPLILSSGQELRIWYAEDLSGIGEENNSGTTCVDVYTKYK